MNLPVTVILINEMKKFNDRFEELQFKRDWCLLIIGYLKDNDSDSNKSIWITMAEDIKNGCDSIGLRGLRPAYNDINEMAKAMRNDDIIKLNIILREKFGEDLTTVNKRIAARIQKIEERGYIKTEVEWRMVREWIDHIMWDDSKDKEAELLEKLMSEYDKSIEKKRAARKLKNRNSTKK